MTVWCIRCLLVPEPAGTSAASDDGVELVRAKGRLRIKSHGVFAARVCAVPQTFEHF